MKRTRPSQRPRPRDTVRPARAGSNSGELILADHALVAVKLALYPVPIMKHVGSFGQQANDLVASPATVRSELAVIGRKADHLSDRKLVFWHAFKPLLERPVSGSTPSLPRVPSRAVI